MDVRNSLTGLLVGAALGVHSTSLANPQPLTEIKHDDPDIKPYIESQRSCEGTRARHPACRYPKQYTITPLLGITAATALNSEGQVTGITVGEDRQGENVIRRWHAGLWRNGTVTDLGMLGCRSTVSICQSGAKAVNVHGHVVGESTNDYFSPYYLHAFLWRDSTEGMIALQEPAGGEWSSATGINDNGNTVGYGRWNGDYLEHGWININNEFRVIGEIGQNSRANAINNNNRAAGAINVGGMAYAFLWQDNTIILAGLFGKLGSHAYDLNNKAVPQVVGSSRTLEGLARGFLWQPGVMNDSKGVMYNLGVLDDAQESTARAINNRGQIVGNSGGRGVIWQNGEVRDLNSLLPNIPNKRGEPDTLSKAMITDAIDIDWRGRILAVGESGANYLLTPVY